MNDPHRILVVGGHSRIGRSVVRGFLERGWVVEATTRRAEDHDAWRRDIATDVEASRLRLLSLDLSDARSIQGFLADRAEGPLDAVVVAASPFDEIPLEEATMEAYAAHAAAQVGGPAMLVAGLSESLRASTLEGGAAVVLFGDVHALLRPRPKATPYLAAKAAVEGLVGLLARELAPVRVFGMSPGLVGEVHAWSDEDIERYVDRLPLARAGTCEEAAASVAAAILELRYSTGLVIPIDGGRHLV